MHALNGIRTAQRTIASRRTRDAIPSGTCRNIPRRSKSGTRRRHVVDLHANGCLRGLESAIEQRLWPVSVRVRARVGNGMCGVAE